MSTTEIVLFEFSIISEFVSMIACSHTISESELKIDTHYEQCKQAY